MGNFVRRKVMARVAVVRGRRKIDRVRIVWEKKVRNFRRIADNVEDELFLMQATYLAEGRRYCSLDRFWMFLKALSWPVSTLSDRGATRRRHVEARGGLFPDFAELTLPPISEKVDQFIF